MTRKKKIEEINVSQFYAMEKRYFTETRLLDSIKPLAIHILKECMTMR